MWSTNARLAGLAWQRRADSCVEIARRSEGSPRVVNRMAGRDSHAGHPRSGRTCEKTWQVFP
ncbi:hypothetical protein KIF53_18915 [Chromobacterium subtsugae]|uniref:DUF397 domain-containing protein n=1 Tax=Chromobacterium subtsugae TaxID=251747 RepID=A0ABS7FI07_9NEIS|nr:hypothetical protein [Chromobacterium subtsugae]MBW8289710.1 hypothetical protein [Chromobacterium subtsugae]